MEYEALEPLELGKICRICLIKQESLVNVTKLVADMLSDCASLEVPFHEFLICSACENEVKKWYSFKQQVLKAFEITQNLAAKIHVPIAQIEIKEEDCTKPESKKHKCPNCEASFTKHGHLRTHLVGHKIEQGYKCENCEKSFKSARSLWGHKRRHCQMKPFPCPQCKKAFPFKYALDRHFQARHTTEATFLCSHCPKMYKVRETLAAHVKKYHSNATSGAFCNVCGKMCVSEANLKVHLRSHTGERPYICEFCILDEIISVLTSKQLITELMRPQAAYSHEAVRDIIEDVTQSSMMRLDPISMGKLWDLITMVFKWQITISEDVIKVTLRHLYEIENYVTNPDTHLQLHKVQNLVDNFNKILSGTERKELRDDLLFWLKNTNVRVSLLLRMGLQNMEGIFITENLEPVAEKMLKNLGENIYSVTQNGRILEKNRNKPEPEVNELQLFVDQILGERSSYNDNRKNLRLAINDPNGNNNNEVETSKIVFDNIDVDKEDKMQEMMKEIDINDKDDGCLRDDLLAMIGGEDLNKE